MQEAVITLRPDGTVEIKAAGFRGKACRDFTRPILAAIGADVRSDRATAEAYEEDRAGETVRAGGRGK